MKFVPSSTGNNGILVIAFKCIWELLLVSLTEVYLNSLIISTAAFENTKEKIAFRNRICDTILQIIVIVLKAN